ncbi:peptidoglycan binding protein, partial [Listeria innocua FSL J1-023]
QLVETKAPVGYILDATPINFTISEAQLNLTVTKENTKEPEIPVVPEKPIIPNKPDVPEKPTVPKTPAAPDKIVSSDEQSTILPKTGDTSFVSGLGILLVAISTAGLIAFRRK